MIRFNVIFFVIIQLFKEVTRGTTNEKYFHIHEYMNLVIYV